MILIQSAFYWTWFLNSDLEYKFLNEIDAHLDSGMRFDPDGMRRQMFVNVFIFCDFD